MNTPRWKKVRHATKRSRQLQEALGLSDLAILSEGMPQAHRAVQNKARQGKAPRSGNEGPGTPVTDAAIGALESALQRYARGDWTLLMRDCQQLGTQESLRIAHQMLERVRINRLSRMAEAGTMFNQQEESKTGVLRHSGMSVIDKRSMLTWCLGDAQALLALQGETALPSAVQSALDEMNAQARSAAILRGLAPRGTAGAGDMHAAGQRALNLTRARLARTDLTRTELTRTELTGTSTGAEARSGADPWEAVQQLLGHTASQMPVQQCLANELLEICWSITAALSEQPAQGSTIQREALMGLPGQVPLPSYLKAASFENLRGALVLAGHQEACFDPELLPHIQRILEVCRPGVPGGQRLLAAAQLARWSAPKWGAEAGTRDPAARERHRHQNDQLTCAAGLLMWRWLPPGRMRRLVEDATLQHLVNTEQAERAGGGGTSPFGKVLRRTLEQQFGSDFGFSSRQAR